MASYYIKSKDLISNTRSLNNQNLENQRKLAELQQEEEFLIQTKLKLMEDLDNFSNKESKMKLERSKAKVILNEKLKIMKIEEKRRRKTEVISMACLR